MSIYTTEDHKPEMILQIMDPNGVEVTSISGLIYDNNLQGFDITEMDGIIPIVENYEITSNSSTSFTEQDWTIKVSFINLDTNQIENEGKTLEGKILIRKERMYSDIVFKTNYVPADIGYFTSINCSGSSALYNQKYDRFEFNDITKNQAICEINYQEQTNKQYLNDYIISLAETSQGNGKIIHEIDKIINYENAVSLNQSEYGNIEMFVSTSSSATSGTINDEIYYFDNLKWNNNSSIMEAQKNYNLKITIPEDGNYQLCYNIEGDGDSDNDILFYYGSTTIDLNGANYVSGTINQNISDCSILGYLKQNEVYRFVHRTGQKISTVNFELKRTDSFDTIDTGYRYEGQNPNNYIWFNNELWRIVGVFDDKIHGVKNNNLVKLVKAYTIGNFPWSTNDSNKWETSNLNHLLNEYYLSKKNGNDSEYCDEVHNCNFEINGINYFYKKMIQNSKWFFGEISAKNGNDKNYASATYNYFNFERNSKYSINLIGMIYASDYGYSVLSETCHRTTKLNRYNSLKCASSSWLYNAGNEWIFNISDYYNHAYYLSADGNTNEFNESAGNVKSNYNVRPSLYLKSNVYVIDGDGSITNPYIIGM